MKMIVKMATRSRPKKFMDVMERYFDNLSGNHEVRFVITCDLDDETMNNQEIKSWFSEAKKKYDIDAFYGNSKSKVEACNADLENEEADVLLLASDDMVPVAKEYDDYIAVAFDKIFPEYDGAIKFNDGLRSDMLMTLPCLGWKLYKAIGHLYHPDYTSVYCDNEQTQVCYKLNKLGASEQCIITHRWIPGNHELADDLHQRNENPEMYKKDRDVFISREKNDFDVESVRAKLETASV
jgi:hypothetical protein|tara:strand:+ start:3079 stop:3792 length:714 start_codon:yes stop_codon:yes gene_type:complete